MIWNTEDNQINFVLPADKFVSLLQLIFISRHFHELSIPHQQERRNPLYPLTTADSIVSRVLIKDRTAHNITYEWCLFITRTYQFNTPTFELVYQLNLQTKELWKHISANQTVSSVHIPWTKQLAQLNVRQWRGKNLTSIWQLSVHPRKPKKKSQQGTIHPPHHCPPNFTSQTNAAKWLLDERTVSYPASNEKIAYLGLETIGFAVLPSLTLVSQK